MHADPLGPFLVNTKIMLVCLLLILLLVLLYHHSMIMGALINAHLDNILSSPTHAQKPEFP